MALKEKYLVILTSQMDEKDCLYFIPDSKNALFSEFNEIVRYSEEIFS
jgi:hypothetical protein